MSKLDEGIIHCESMTPLEKKYISDMTYSAECIGNLTARIAELELDAIKCHDIIMAMAETISSDTSTAPLVALIVNGKPLEDHQAYLCAIVIYYADKVKQEKGAK